MKYPSVRIKVSHYLIILVLDKRFSFAENDKISENSSKHKVEKANKDFMNNDNNNIRLIARTVNGGDISHPGKYKL